MTHELDQGVGRLLDALDQLQLADSTYVIFTSDNGSYHHAGSDRVSSNAPLRGQKASTWEGGIRVPLIVRGPGIEAGSVTRVTAIGTDLYPTIAEMAGVQAELAPTIEGASLLGVLRDGGRGEVSRRFGSLVWHFPHYQTDKGTSPMSSIRVGDWKAVKSYESGKIRLFDLSADIGETTDLSAEEPDVARWLEGRLARYLEEVDAPMARRSK